MKELILADYHQPSLKEGTYKITAKQDAQELGGARTSLEFMVGGPNLGLNGKEIHSVFPGEQAVGQFSNVLPHVVWNRAALPWEVQVNEDEEQPWIWLLLLSDEEIAEIQTKDAAGFSERVDGVFVPQIDVQEPKRSCMYIELPRETFEELCPDLEERKYLCHVRKGMEEENTSRKAGEAKKDEFAVVFGNRLPKSGIEKAHNRVYVVSLEGYGSDEAKTEEAKRNTYVRLLVLYSWDFYSIDNGMEPDAMMKALEYGVPAANKETGDEALNHILENGYVPVRHELQNGDRTVSFYRGPLAPLSLEDKEVSAFSAKELYRYDPNLGMFDVSFACAWQLGRLLTLNQAAIAEKIMKERRKDLQKMHRAALWKGFHQQVGEDANGMESPSETLLAMLEKAVGDKY